jgi:uncharacterized membrane protein YhaH (DUF805 family)
VTAIDPGLYSTSAQVIPAIMIAGLVERGFRRKNTETATRSDVLLGLLTMLSLVAGEIGALLGTAGVHTRLVGELTVSGLTVGLLAVVEAYLDALPSVRRWKHAKPSWWWSATQIVAVMLLVATPTAVGLAVYQKL